MPEPTPVAGTLNGENGSRVAAPWAVIVTTDSRALATTSTRSAGSSVVEADCASVGADVGAGASATGDRPPKALTMPNVNPLPSSADSMATASRVRIGGVGRSCLGDG